MVVFHASDDIQLFCSYRNFQAPSFCESGGTPCGEPRRAVKSCQHCPGQTKVSFGSDVSRLQRAVARQVQTRGGPFLDLFV